MQWNGLYKEMNPPERRDEHSSRKERERERERENVCFVKISSLLINDKSILELVRVKVYTEFSFFSFVLSALVLLVLNL